MLHHQSLVLADQERFAEAESMMWQAMAIRRLHVSAEDKTFWAHHAILATILAKQNKFHLAAQQVRLALDISQQAGRTEEQVASDYSLLAIYLRQAGDLVEAEKASLQCLELSEAVLSFNDPKLAIRFGLHSKILEQQKKWAEARQWLERSIELQLKHVPADDSTMASQYNNLGLICKRQGNYAEALLQLTKAIEINRKYLPPEDPTLATNYHNVSTIHQSLGDLQKALQWNLMAAPIVERLPDRHRIRGILERSRIALQRLLTGR
jgi:tetratricopeptide (TPR) repeat protein